MAGKRRSGLANDRRAYKCTARCPPTYTVTYLPNGSTTGNVPKDRSSPYKVGLPVTVLGNVGVPASSPALPPLAKPGYIFVEWNTEADGSGVSYSQGDQITITNANIILHAQWTPIYTVTYFPNGSTRGSAPTDNLSPYIAGSSVTVLGNSGALEKSGFAFAGWSESQSGSGTSYSQYDTFTINADKRLYAKWAPTYTVTYDDNDSTTGSVPVDTARYIAGSTVTVLGNTGSLVQTNSSFSGWNTQSDGLGTSYSIGPPPATFTINANVTLYAKWTLLNVPLPPTALSSVGGDQAAYILFTQSGTVTNYEYSTDNGVTFVAFNPPQIYSPVNINTLSSNVLTRLTNGTTYTVRLKAVNSGLSSDQSDPVTVEPGTTELLADNRLIYLDANSYSGSGTAWTNLVSSGAYSATLNGSPTFNSTDAGNKFFQFNPGAATGQFALINENVAINPVVNQPFTIQMWVKINNVGSQGTLVSKVFVSPSWDGYALGYMANTTLQLHSNGSQVNYYSSVAGVLSSGWTLYTANVQFGNGGGRQNKIFVNGRQVMSVTNTDGISNTNQNMTFPSGFYGEGECDIGQFYYYNTELTQTQIIQNFDATKSRYNV
jgi:uncharacterized repeat protein (TIGR02543 family)